MPYQLVKTGMAVQFHACSELLWVCLVERPAAGAAVGKVRFARLSPFVRIGEMRVKLLSGCKIGMRERSPDSLRGK